MLKEPFIPGPDKNKPKASLYEVFSNALYSSEANTKPKFNVSDVGTKSNSITAASLTELT